MTQTQRINIQPIIDALAGKPLPERDENYLQGYLNGTRWYSEHVFDLLIDDRYVRACVYSWHRRNLFSGEWEDVLNFHIGFTLAMVDGATNEQLKKN